MFRVFHGCMSKNSDGTNRVIEKNFICLCPTSQPFWKRARDVDFGVRTRSQELGQGKVKLQDFNRYCRFRGQEDIRTWIEADESVVYYLKKNRLFLHCKIMYSNQILLHGFISNVSFLYDQSGSKISHILVFSLCVQKPLFLNSLEYRRYFLHLSQVRQYSHEFWICISCLNSISSAWFLSV